MDKNPASSALAKALNQLSERSVLVVNPDYTEDLILAEKLVHAGRTYFIAGTRLYVYARERRMQERKPESV